MGAHKEDGGHKREEHMQDPTGGQEGNNAAGEANTAMDEEDGEFLDEDQAEQHLVGLRLEIRSSTSASPSWWPRPVRRG